ncbi:hypothetical protein MHYP_G00185550 [Metynnis hypsauchen]
MVLTELKRSKLRAPQRASRRTWETLVFREGTEQERETDENPESEEAESEIQAECETQTENICASTSTGPSEISKCKEDPPMQPDLKLTVNIPQIHYERREIKQSGCTEHRV